MNNFSFSLNVYKNEDGTSKTSGYFYNSEEDRKNRNNGYMVVVIPGKKDPEKRYLRGARIVSQGETAKWDFVGELFPHRITEENRLRIMGGDKEKGIKALPYANGTLDLTKVGGPKVGKIVLWYHKGPKGVFFSVTPEGEQPEPKAPAAPAPPVVPPVAADDEIPF